MRIDTISTFPNMFDSVMGESMMKRAQEAGALQLVSWDLRDWTYDRHKTTDDAPYGGGCGLVMKCEPIFEATRAVLEETDISREDTSVIFLAPQGRLFNDELASSLSKKKRMVFVCGHYEGIDERAYSLADEVICLGDYVLTSGELAAMVVSDAVVRKLPGVLGAECGAETESFVDGLLEYPQYTRPAVFEGMEVPEVLLSGHHANIEAWRRKMSLLITKKARPDLIQAAKAKGLLTEKDMELLDSDEA